MREVVSVRRCSGTPVLFWHLLFRSEMRKNHEKSELPSFSAAGLGLVLGWISVFKNDLARIYQAQLALARFKCAKNGECNQ